MSEETKVSNETEVDSGTENVTQEPAQNEYIAESKKYRKRAQEAESKLSELQKQLEQQENAKLKEKEEFKTLAEKFEAQVNELNPYKEKYNAMVEQRKSVLLNKLPEDKREQFKDKDLDVLEFMVSQLNSKTPTEPNVRATVKGKPLSDDWHKMSKQDKEKNWKDIVKSFAKK
jgi:hypothetical protein